MIEIKDLSVNYGPIPALQDLSLEIKEGEFVLVSGPSGCGKSTLAHVLMGLVPEAIPATVGGQVRVAGMDPLTVATRELARVVGCVFQNPGTQLFHLSVGEEIAFGPRNLGWDEGMVQKSVDEALTHMAIGPLRDQNPQELSRGQQQRLAIASVLAMRPNVLILDEPTASLDVPGTGYLMRRLRHLHENLGITILMVEHRMAGMLPLLDRVLLLEKGRLVADGSSQAVLADEALRERLGLRRPSRQAVSSWNRLVRSNGTTSGTREPLVSFKDVSAGYGPKEVLRDVSFDLYPGEFVALVGDNGVGKSTLGLVAAGLLKPSSGRVLYQERRRPRPGLDVALLFQDPSSQLFTDSVDEEVAFGPHNYARFDAHRHTETLAVADLLQLKERNLLSLSVGQQQRTALAACVATHPRLLILDEPTLGQDWGHLATLMDYLRSLNDLGITILLISHDYKLVHHYAARILLMKDGQVHPYRPLKQRTGGAVHAL